MYQSIGYWNRCQDLRIAIDEILTVFYRDFDTVSICLADGVQKLLSGSPWPQCMGTGRPDSNLEHIEYRNRIVWQVVCLV